ncbi:VOC family protein [Amnibacterium endophyticum]|uniref:VOC family protein n=1 Tax=Amnibacterium endophyticum TaxID=2109337 RepID=A0ABW4LGJ8_9MICO
MTNAVPFVHHFAVIASDFEASERIFTAALGALGVEALHRADGVAEYWRPEEDRLSFSLERARHDTSVTRRVHVAFAAEDRAGVDRFHAAAVSAGAVSRHAPRFWPEYRAYCAFLRDPDGNNIEALHKEGDD